MRRLGFLAAALLASGCSTTRAPGAGHVLDIDNRVPKFEAFYSDATVKQIDADARWALWRKEYGLAAVPPGDEGQKIARGQLDAVWDRYPALLPKVDVLETDAESGAHEAFARVNVLLGSAGTPIHSRVVLYVGQFDDNAFTIPAMDNKPSTVMMPVETPNIRVTFAHELTHSVHMQLAGVKNGFGAPIGETMFLEGLAMQTSQRAFPGLPEYGYVAMAGDKEWIAHCRQQKDLILKGISPDLDKSGRDIAMKYTFGQGNTGMQREVYCAAWVVMGKLIASGKTLPELARIPEDRMVDTIRAAMAR